MSYGGFGDVLGKSPFKGGFSRVVLLWGVLATPAGVTQLQGTALSEVMPFLGRPSANEW